MHESKNGELMWVSQQLDPFIKTNSEEILLPSIDSSHSLFEFDSLNGEFKKFSYSINDIFDNSPFVLYNKEYITYRFIHQYRFDLNSGMICKDNCSSYLGIKDMLPFVVTQYQISSIERDGPDNKFTISLYDLEVPKNNSNVLRFDINTQQLELYDPIQFLTLWSKSISFIPMKAFIYHRRSNFLEVINIQYSSIQNQQIYLGNFVYDNQQQVYSIVPDYLNVCFDTENEVKNQKNMYRKNRMRFGALYIDSLEQVNDQTITSKEFKSITKDEFNKYEDIQSYIKELKQNSTKMKKKEDVQQINETTFILILSLITVVLGLIVVVMIVYINYIQKGINSSSLSVHMTPTKYIPKDMNYIGEQFSCSKKVLGHGSLGTIVFEGTANGRKVAVKRMVKEFYTFADNEMKIINMTDEKPHLVRYYGSFEDDNFVYLAITFCPYTLDDYLIKIEEIENEKIDEETKENNSSKRLMKLNKERVRLMKECAIGVYYLHSLGIVHRDIKPLNVLIDENRGIRITDFGLAKKLDPSTSSFSNSTTKGSIGWQAPEMLDDSCPRLSKAVDIFTLGCLFYYIATRKHPYGNSLVRQNNILKGICIKTECSFDNLYQSEFIACFNGMNKKSPNERITIEEVLSHPLFWSCKKRLEFIQKVSDIIIADKNYTISKRLDSAGVAIQWDKELSPIILQTINKYRIYDFNHTIDLLRVIRNESHHYYTLPQEEKDLYGTFPDGFYKYFHFKFPSLFTVLYSFVKEFYSHSDALSEFFTPDL
ncbi:hypothetical protein ENUP19_0275G0018 [Entamoeba nuttalli]|uniref:non-specific serine/threonine protein kinase n=2 Tax=Entamoeba nuttalli TaxID=412467 RepID=K2GXV0_ENTNP|nr:protein kinase, putative [Entamoeba nuttalli P19]EKE40083.1 protein kinase, putative [Entamoeba nuttalli P19]|eukprot:XP_008857578.1 protein kinase, putative [Entamoeba nuttalli P19]